MAHTPSLPSSVSSSTRLQLCPDAGAQRGHVLKEVELRKMSPP
jgi:hypothetical protein